MPEPVLHRSRTLPHVPDRPRLHSNLLSKTSASNLKSRILLKVMSNGRDDQPNQSSLFCDAWDGSRSPLFLKFKRDFEAGADAIFLHEDDWSIWQACIGMDQGGQANGADPMPAQGQNGYTNAVRRRRKRQAKAFNRHAKAKCSELLCCSKKVSSQRK